MLSFEGIEAGRAVRLRALVDVGWAVAIERPLGEEGEVCIIEDREVRVVGRGPTADAAAADARSASAPVVSFPHHSPTWQQREPENEERGRSHGGLECTARASQRRAGAAGNPRLNARLGSVISACCATRASRGAGCCANRANGKGIPDKLPGRERRRRSGRDPPRHHQYRHRRLSGRLIRPHRACRDGRFGSLPGQT